MSRLILLLASLALAHAQNQQISITNKWDGGFQAEFTIHADHVVHGWRTHLIFDKPLSKLEIWTAKVLETKNGGREFVVGNMPWDGDLNAGQDLTVSFVGRVDGGAPQGTYFTEGMGGGSSSGSSGGNTGTDTTSRPCQDDNAQCVTWVGFGECTNTPDYMLTYCRLSCKQCTPSSGSHTGGSGGSTSTGGGSTGSGGGSTGSGSGSSGSGSTGSGGTPIQPGTATSGGSAMKYNYGEALGMSILFYDAQRSGKLPDNNPISWRGDSALNDGQDNGKDLTGGWYDAGDNVKFNFPMAYSTYILAYGILRYKDGYEKAGQLNMACDMIKWPLEYFLKCWDEKAQELYVQVGDGNADHAFWGRPENMRMRRPSFKVTASRPGSDVAGDTASALAAGALVFKNVCGDKQYANNLLSAAKSVYTFAKNHKGIYSQSVNAAAQFYGSSGYKDELAVAASWLHMATKEPNYLQDAKGFHEGGTPWALSWDDKKIFADLLLYEITKDNAYKTDVEGFVRSYMPGGNVPHTPCGLAWRDQWGSNRYAGNAAFVALAAAADGIQPDDFKKWALTQINYLLGDNKYHISYEIGFGSKYPKQPHHRGSSCSTTQNPCQPSGDNPNVLKGALVGGPDRSDNYQDSRGDYVKNEVACDYNAGFQSALAALVHFVANNQLPASPPSKC